MKAKCKGYRFAVEWVAFNDDAVVLDISSIAESISVCLIADLFSITAFKVATDVLKLRNNNSELNAC